MLKNIQHVLIAKSVYCVNNLVLSEFQDYFTITKGTEIKSIEQGVKYLLKVVEWMEKDLENLTLLKDVKDPNYEVSPGKYEPRWVKSEISGPKYKEIYYDAVIDLIHSILFNYDFPPETQAIFTEKYPLPKKWKKNLAFKNETLNSESSSSSRWALGIQKTKKETARKHTKNFHVKFPVARQDENEYTKEIKEFFLKRAMIDTQLELIGAELFHALTNDPRKVRGVFNQINDIGCDEVKGRDDQTEKFKADHRNLQLCIATEKCEQFEAVKRLFLPDDLVQLNIEVFVYLYMTAQDDHSGGNFMVKDSTIKAIDFGRGFFSAGLTKYSDCRNEGFEEDPFDCWAVVSGNEAFSVKAEDIECLPALFINTTENPQESIDVAKQHFTPRRWATQTDHFDLTAEQNIAKYRAFIKGIILIPAIIQNIIADHMCPKAMTAQKLVAYLKKRVDDILTECLKIPLFCQLIKDKETYQYLRKEFIAFNNIQLDAERTEKCLPLEKLLKESETRLKTRLQDPLSAPAVKEIVSFSSVKTSGQEIDLKENHNFNQAFEKLRLYDC